MKKIFKPILLSLITILACSNTEILPTRQVSAGPVNQAYEKFRINALKYGYSIADDWLPINGLDFKTFTFEEYDKSHVQYRVTISEVILRNTRNQNVYAYAYRTELKPIATRNSGFLGIGSHSDTWYSRGYNIFVNLPAGSSITNWVPHDDSTPVNRHSSMGVAYGTGGNTIITSEDYSSTYLVLNDRTNVSARKFDNDYTITGTTDYARNASDYHGCFVFTSSVEPASSFMTEHSWAFYGKHWFGMQTGSTCQYPALL